ncbi:MAG: hypothetical protein ACFFEN_05205 [Candidatus Thorarchaeota archaeon]
MLFTRGPTAKINKKKKGNWPKNSPKKISPGLAGEVNKISLCPISDFLYNIKMGYITYRTKRTIKEYSIKVEKIGIVKYEIFFTTSGIMASKREGPK